MLSASFRRYRFVVLTNVISFAFICSLYAQGPGVAASVTSHGFGGHTGSPGIPASVTAHGSFAPNHPIVMRPPIIVNRFFPQHPRPVHEPRRPRRSFFPGTVIYPVPYYPFAYDYDEMDDSANQQMETQQQPEDQYNGGPTIFDRRGPGSDYFSNADTDRTPPEQPTQAIPESQASREPEQQPAPLQPTVLIFKDGHQMEVANYAIVGNTLFDLTPGHPRRVPVSDLDINATQKQNDDRGVDFRLPAGPQGE